MLKALGPKLSPQAAVRFTRKQMDATNTLAEAAQMMFAACNIEAMREMGFDIESVLERTKSLDQFTRGWRAMDRDEFSELAGKDPDMLRILIDERFSADAQKRTGFPEKPDMAYRGPDAAVDKVFAPVPSRGEPQGKYVFDKLQEVLAKTGSDMRHLVKGTYYVCDDDAARWVDRTRPLVFDPDRPPAASKVMVHGMTMAGRTMTIDMIAVERK